MAWGLTELVANVGIMRNLDESRKRILLSVATVLDMGEDLWFTKARVFNALHPYFPLPGEEKK